MSSNPRSTWFERASVADSSRARLTAWRRHPKRMLRQRLKPTSPPSNRPDLADGTAEVLARVRTLPIGYWSYGWEDSETRHLGPMAQDFWEAFGLGTTDRRISSVDINGVLLASVQALLERVEALEAELEGLRSSDSVDS